MTKQCPTCGRRLTKPLPSKEPQGILLKPGDVSGAWDAWMDHFRREKQRYSIQYWERRGYMRVPTQFPPGYVPAQSDLIGYSQQKGR